MSNIFRTKGGETMIDLGRIGKTLEKLGIRLEKESKHKPKGKAKKKAKRRK